MDHHYYVLAAAARRGPFTIEELREALDEGTIERFDQVSSAAGRPLGSVSALLRRASASRPVVTGFLSRQPRSTVITLVALVAVVVALVGMFIALHTTAVSVPPPRADSLAAGTAAPDAPPTPAATAPANPLPPPVAPAAAEPAGAALGVQSGTVRSILSFKDAVLAVGATRVGGPNHKVDILNGEVAHNAFDGKLESKYFNPNHDGERPNGVGTGFAITPRKAETVTAFQFATANDFEGRDPLTITIEGSDAEGADKDQGQGFATIYDGPSGLEADPGRKQWGKCVVFANTTAYRTYRVLVSRLRDNQSNGAQYSEFRLGALALAAAAKR